MKGYVVIISMWGSVEPILVVAFDESDARSQVVEMFRDFGSVNIIAVNELPRGTYMMASKTDGQKLEQVMKGN